MNILSLLLAILIIIIFSSIESSLRFGDEAKSRVATEKDKKSTSYLGRAIGVNFIVLLWAFFLNHFNAGLICKNYLMPLWGNLIMVSGLLIRVVATRTLREYYTRTLKIQANQKIITSGLYRFIRHPGYLGVTMLWIGAGLASNNYFVLIIISLVTLTVYRYRINREEEMLLEAFGEDYENYKKKTWKIIPFIY